MRRALVAVSFVLVLPEAIAAASGPTARFFAGAATMLGAHEAAHLACDVAFAARPRLTTVHFGPVPFFAIEPTARLSPRREYVTTSAGFDAQHVASEWILTAHPALRDQSRPFLKGMFAFHVLASTGYGVAALAKAGPVQRDTRGMAEALGMNERAIGVFVLAPAALDAYRYYHPEARWATWASRVAKMALAGLVIKGR